MLLMLFIYLTHCNVINVLTHCNVINVIYLLDSL